MFKHSLRIILGALLGFTASTATARPAENLLLVTLDGMRWQEVFGGADARLLIPELKNADNVDALKAKFWADTPEARREILMPFLWKTIAKEGQIYGHAESNSPAVVTNRMNFSYPGYNELLTGAPDPRVDSNDKKYNENISVLEWLNQREGFKDGVVAFASWDVFPFILNEKRCGFPVNAGWVPLTVSPDPAHLAFLNQISDETPHVWDGVRFDFTTFHGTVEYIKAKSPRVIYVSLGETDDWAHDGRYDMYLDSAHRSDEYLKRLWDLLQSLPQYAGKTALVVSTDHGRGDTTENWKDHGDEVPGSERIWMALYGAGVPAKGIVKDTPITQSQYAATGAALIGQDFTAAFPKAAKAIVP